MRCPGLTPGKTFELRLVGLQVNGLSFNAEEFSFSVSRQGIADVEQLQIGLAAAPIVAALRHGQPEKARALTQALSKKDPAWDFASPMLVPPGERSSRVAADVKEVSLCDLRPERAKVGWRTPAYDYSPEDLLVYRGSRIERRFIYAHAPSSYSWLLDGRWKRFSATCALGNGYDGSVVFVVKVDGVERWRSGLIQGDAQKRCDLDIKGARSLELLVEDGGDNYNRDHGFWFSPVLTRE